MRRVRAFRDRAAAFLADVVVYRIAGAGDDHDGGGRRPALGAPQITAALKRLEQERVLERERTRLRRTCTISWRQAVPDFLLSEHARRCEAVTVEHQQEMRSISDDSREVLQSLDEMVWAVNPQNDTLDHLMSYIGQYAQEYFRKTASNVS